jgi:hypothetical protein
MFRRPVNNRHGHTAGGATTTDLPLRRATTSACRKCSSDTDRRIGVGYQSESFASSALVSASFGWRSVCQSAESCIAAMYEKRPHMPRRVQHRSSGGPRARGVRSRPLWPSGSHECQFPSCDSMTHGNGLPLALFSWGVAFGLERRCRHAALTSHGISSAGRPGPRERGDPWLRPGGSDGGPAPGRAQRRCPAQDALTWRCGRP